MMPARSPCETVTSTRTQYGLDYGATNPVARSTAYAYGKYISRNPRPFLGFATADKKQRVEALCDLTRSSQNVP